jgi:hypothetical protein
MDKNCAGQLNVAAVALAVAAALAIAGLLLIIWMYRVELEDDNE